MRPASSLRGFTRSPEPVLEAQLLFSFAKCASHLLLSRGAVLGETGHVPCPASRKPSKGASVSALRGGERGRIESPASVLCPSPCLQHRRPRSKEEAKEPPGARLAFWPRRLLSSALPPPPCPPSFPPGLLAVEKMSCWPQGPEARSAALAFRQPQETQDLALRFLSWRRVQACGPPGLPSETRAPRGYGPPQPSV